MRTLDPLTREAILEVLDAREVGSDELAALEDFSYEHGFAYDIAWAQETILLASRASATAGSTTSRLTLWKMGL